MGQKPIPEKIEKRLMELLQMEEFDMEEVQACRAGYWDAREDWHMILVNCYESAKARIANSMQTAETPKPGFSATN